MRAPLLAHKRRRLQAWANRLAPFNHKDPWRGPLARLSAPAPHAQPWGNQAGLLVRAASGIARWALCHGRWAGVFPRPARPAAATPRPAFHAAQRALRGLGGLHQIKLRYKGKSFKWRRRRRALLLRFGHSHLVALRPTPGIRWRRHGRMKLLFRGSAFADIAHFLGRVCYQRPMNVYHGRGLRVARCPVLRKAGKVSAYR